MEKSVYKSNRGQLSIFMGVSLIIVMSLLAFVVNVGLFVKAKINLQNATDAAAFAGASTQARQLTNIAYMNWELRNVFKEWMFKYYVLGQLGPTKPGSSLSDQAIKSNPIDFRLRSAVIPGHDIKAKDLYNIPSICVHNSSSRNICEHAVLPGLPRFPAIQVAGISEIHEAFVNKLVGAKQDDCSNRSQLNFLAALSWAFNNDDSSNIPNTPLIAANRAGAWPKSLEIAFRIRNLEMILNRPPITTPIDRNNVQQLNSVGADISLNERPLKAFWTLYRNLSGGNYKSNKSSVGSARDELTYNLKMVELAPNPFQSESFPLSSFLINSNFSYPGQDGIKATQKHYVDLQVMPVNYSTMYTSFVSMNYGMTDNTAVEGACAGSKTALPVPGYILGFVKNPNVLTYYAIKAESKFIGLFSPFLGTSSQDGVTLTAYSAAKPFGGRIGPKLFDFLNHKSTIPRNDLYKKSNSYSSGIITGIAYTPGMPIPSGLSTSGTNLGKFWVGNNASPNQTLGGIPDPSELFPAFGIPNLIYDVDSTNPDDSLRRQGNATDTIQKIMQKDGGSPNETLGLYDSFQYRSLRASIGNITSDTNSFTGNQLHEAIIKSMRPTLYDAINYLVPTFQAKNSNGDLFNAIPIIKNKKPITGLNNSFTYDIFAPLSGPSLLYKTEDDVKSTINAYVDANVSSVNTYTGALFGVAKNILNLQSTDPKSNIAAAKSIHFNVDNNNPDPGFLVTGNCRSDIATVFNHFFKAEYAACNTKPLKILMREYITKKFSGSPIYYTGEYFSDETGLTVKPESLMTAFSPSPRQGVGTDDRAMAETPLRLNGNYSAVRNYYSTKFFNMAKVMEKSPNIKDGSLGKIEYQNNVYRESTIGTGAGNDVQSDIINTLSYDAASGLNQKFFLDF